jgi:hypothetical protein
MGSDAREDAQMQRLWHDMDNERARWIAQILRQMPLRAGKGL